MFSVPGYTLHITHTLNLECRAAYLQEIENFKGESSQESGDAGSTTGTSESDDHDPVPFQDSDDFFGIHYSDNLGEQSVDSKLFYT